MLTLLFAVKRRSDLSLEQFTRYWVQNHAPLVLSVPSFAQYVRRYVIYPLIGDTGTDDFVLGQFPDYDGIGELRFDDADAMKKAFADPGYTSIIRPDEDQFLNRDACVTFVTRELVQKELAAD